MDATEVLSVLAEVSVAFAGFSGIVTAFRRRDPGAWSRVDRFRFRFMVEFSLATLSLSLVPLVLGELGMDEARVWSVSSLVLGVGALLYLLRSALRLRRIVAAGEAVSRSLAVVSIAIGIAIAASALANAAGVFARPPGVYLAGVSGCPFVSSAMFARLLLANSSHPDEDDGTDDDPTP
jgi:hypothetical protein